MGISQCLCLAQADQDQEGDVHHHEDQPDDHRDDGDDPAVSHIDICRLGPRWGGYIAAVGTRTADAPPSHHGHGVATTGKVDQRGGDKGQDDAQDNLRGRQSVVQPASAHRRCNDDAGHNANASG